MSTNDPQIIDKQAQAAAAQTLASTAQHIASNAQKEAAIATASDKTLDFCKVTATDTRLKELSEAAAEADRKIIEHATK